MNEETMYRVSVVFSTDRGAKSFVALLEGCGYSPVIDEVTSSDVSTAVKQDILRKELTPFG